MVISSRPALGAARASRCIRGLGGAGRPAAGMGSGPPALDPFAVPHVRIAKGGPQRGLFVDRDEQEHHEDEYRPAARHRAWPAERCLTTQALGPGGRPARTPDEWFFLTSQRASAGPH